jgi:hypothetical protein
MSFTLVNSRGFVCPITDLDARPPNVLDGTLYLFYLTLLSLNPNAPPRSLLTYTRSQIRFFTVIHLIFPLSPTEIGVVLSKACSVFSNFTAYHVSPKRVAVAEATPFTGDRRLECFPTVPLLHLHENDQSLPYLFYCRYTTSPPFPRLYIHVLPSPPFFWTSPTAGTFVVLPPDVSCRLNALDCNLSNYTYSVNPTTAVIPKLIPNGHDFLPGSLELQSVLY